MGDETLYKMILLLKFDKEIHKYTVNSYYLYWKHQALSTDIFSTSWPTKEIARELEQQSFPFPTSRDIPATEPFLQSSLMNLEPTPAGKNC